MKIQRYQRRRFLQFTGTAGVLTGTSAFLAACSGGSTTNGKPNAPATSGAGPATGSQSAATAAPSAGSAGAQPASATRAAAQQPQRGGKLTWRDVWGGGGDPTTLNLYPGGGARTVETVSYVYPQVLSYKTGPDVGPLDFLVQPDLATAMPEQPDNLTYVFHLNDKAVWENKPPANGRAVTTDDILYNYKQLNATGPTTGRLLNVDQIQAVDQRTFKVTLKSPVASFPVHFVRLTIANPEIVDSKAAEKTTLSAGPYIMTDYQIGTSFTYKRNPSYYRTGVPYIDTLERLIIPDDATAQANFRSGQLDAIQVDRADVVSQLATSVKGMQQHKSPNHSDYWLGMDLRNPIFKDKRVRQAVSKAIDRDELLKIYGGQGLWNLPFGALGQYYTDPKTPAFGANGGNYLYDPKAAKQLMQAAGVQSLSTITLYFTQFLRGNGAVQEAELISEKLKQNLGADIKLQELQFADVYAKVISSATYDGIAIAQDLVGADPNEYCTLLWDPNDPAERVPGIDAVLKDDTDVLNLIKQQRGELDQQKRIGIIKHLQDVLSDRMYKVPLVLPYQYFVTAAKVRNLNWIFGYYPGNTWIQETWVQQ